MRLTLRIDRALVLKLYGLVYPAGSFRSLSEALRAGLGKALDALDAGGSLPETTAGDWQIVALKISPELDARIGKAVAAGRAPSVVALVRGAAAMLVEGRA